MTSDYAYYLILNTGISSLELDEIISKNSHYSWDYAKNVIKGRFELGEKAISEDWFCSWRYAINVLRGRFKLGELKIAKAMNFDYHVYYLVKIMGYNHD